MSGDSFRDSLAYKLAMLLTLFPVMIGTIVFDAVLYRRGIANPFLKKGIPRDIGELARSKTLQRDFFNLLKSGEVLRGGGGGQLGDAASVSVTGAAPSSSASSSKQQPLIPCDAIYVSVKVGEGTAAEPGKNRAVGCVDVTYRLPHGSSSPISPAGRSVTITESLSMGGGGGGDVSASSPPSVVVTLHLFVKLATVRDWPTLFKALISTFTASTKEKVVFDDLVPLMQSLMRVNVSSKGPASPSDAAELVEGAHNNHGNCDNRKKAAVGANHHLLTPRPFKAGPPSFPIPIPTCHYVYWSRCFDRSMGVYDWIDTSTWRAVADSQMVTEVHLTTLVRSIAQLHALTVGRVGDFASKHNRWMLGDSGAANETASSAASLLARQQLFEITRRIKSPLSDTLLASSSSSNISSNTINAAVCEAIRRAGFEGSATGWLQSILDAFKMKMTDPAVAKKFNTPQHQALAREVSARIAGDATNRADITTEEYNALNDGAFFLRVWDGLAKRFEREVTCISHGDCRPGNKLFCGGGGGGVPDSSVRPENTIANDDHPQHCDTTAAGFVRSLTPMEEDANGRRYDRETATMIHLDWEACSLTPLLYDVAYILGGRPERRRAEVVLLKEYLSALRDAVGARLDREGVDSAALREEILSVCVPAYDVALTHVRMHYLLQAYFGWVLGEFGGVGQAQGNAKADSERWAIRGANNLRAATADCEAMAKEIGNGVSAMDLRLLRYKLLTENMNFKAI